MPGHWPVCAFQILMVASSLPLAMFFPSRVHATERTLPFSMRWFSTRSNPGMGEKLHEKKKKKSHWSECPVRFFSFFSRFFFFFLIHIFFRIFFCQRPHVDQNKFWKKIWIGLLKKKNLTRLSARSPGNWGWIYIPKKLVHACTCNSGCLCCQIVKKISTPCT